MEENKFVQITRQKKIAEAEFYPMIGAMFEQIWQNLLPPQILTDGLTVKRANNVITPPDAPVPDCVTCGVCCGAMLCVGVRPNDEQISEENYWDITIEGAEGEIVVDRYLRRDAETLACAMLEIGEQKTCKIYETRPKMCRDFDAGSDKCHALRRVYGIEPFLSLEEMSEALQKLDAQPAKSAPSETIKEVRFIETETGDLRVSAFLKDGSHQTIYVFNPKGETWRQFEFDGLTLTQAADLIASRKQTV
jgi:Fe-S-cluster containining protein